MDWTTLAPYAAAAVALVVGVGSAILSARTARHTLEGQRMLSREERLWDKQSELYVELIEWSTAAIAAGNALRRNLDEGATVDANERARAIRIPAELSARATAFASDEVDSALDAVREAVEQYIDLAPLPSREERTGGTGIGVTGIGVRIRGLAEQIVALKKAQAALSDVRQVVRDELQPRAGAQTRQ